MLLNMKKATFTGTCKASHCADDNRFTRSASSAHTAASARSFVLVLGLAADEGFVYLDDADKLTELVLLQTGAMRHTG